MNKSSPIRIVSGMLCATSVLLLPIFSYGYFSFPMAIVFPMQSGIIGLGFVIIYRYRCKTNAWDGSIPRFLKISLPLVTVIGAVCIAYAISGFNSDISSSGRLVHHMNAYFDGGQCYATFNREASVKMQSDFCLNFQSHAGTFICGFWMTFSSVLGWFSWKFNGPVLSGEEGVNFERNKRRDEW